MIAVFCLFNFNFLFLSAENISYKRVTGAFFDSSRLDESTRVESVGVPVIFDNGILFTFSGLKDDEVFVSTSFLDWKKRVKMKAWSYGVFSVFLPIDFLPKANYAYKYLVNGIWQNDASQPFFSEVDGLSFFRLEESLEYRRVSPVQISSRAYRFYLEDKGFAEVAWIGEGNNWNPESSPMKKQGKYWSVDKLLQKNQTLYAFYADGQIMLDPLNAYIGKTAFSLKVSRMLENLYFIP